MKANKSEQMRELFRQGWTVADIARMMNVRYQYAYNVISFYVKSTEGAMRYVAGASDTDSVRVHG